MPHEKKLTKLCFIDRPLQACIFNGKYPDPGEPPTSELRFKLADRVRANVGTWTAGRVLWSETGRFSQIQLDNAGLISYRATPNPQQDSLLLSKISRQLDGCGVAAVKAVSRNQSWKSIAETVVSLPIQSSSVGRGCHDQVGWQQQRSRANGRQKSRNQ